MLLAETEPKVGKVFTDTNFRTGWARACATVGLSKRELVEPKDGYARHRYNGLIVHDLRRSAIRNFVNAGVSERVAMRISGHKARAVFDRYHIPSTADVTAAMQRVATAALPPGKPVQQNGAKLVQNRSRNRRKLLKGA
jgi:hypothetical protein